MTLISYVIKSLTKLATTVDRDKKIHLILDNGSSHTSEELRLWLAEHPQFCETYRPVHVS